MLKIQQIFHVVTPNAGVIVRNILDKETRRVRIPHWIELWPRKTIQKWPQVMIPRWIATPGKDSTLNCDRVMIPRCIVTLSHDSTLIYDLGLNSTLNRDPESWFND